MFCPSCNHILQQLEVTTNSGGKFAVDHCGCCGGTWFDTYEINRIPYHEVARLAKLTVLPSKPLHNNNHHELSSQHCPRCHKLLINPHFDTIPAGIHLLRCPHCHGIWATQKALEDFKKNQVETIEHYTVEKTAFPSLSVVFLPALFCLLLFLFTFVTITNLQKAKDESIKASQKINRLIILPLTPTSASLTFSTLTPYKSLISYGLSQLEFVSRYISDQPAASHSIILSNLIPGKTYLYRITLIDNFGQAISGDLSFFTQKASF